MYRICKTLSFESGHLLSKHPEDCRFPHGHSRRAEVVLESKSLSKSDMVCDFKLLSKAIKELIASFDHAICMNTKDPMYKAFQKAYGPKVVAFAAKDPTSEVLAKLIFDRISKELKAAAKKGYGPYALGKGVRLARVRIWETASSWAEYEN